MPEKGCSGGIPGPPMGGSDRSCHHANIRSFDCSTSWTISARDGAEEIVRRPRETKGYWSDRQGRHRHPCERQEELIGNCSFDAARFRVVETMASGFYFSVARIT